MLFWFLTAALALLIAALLAMALLRAQGEDEHPAVADLRIYRDQLKDVDRDLARGVLSTEDAERVRAEVGRRILAADAQLKTAEVKGAQPKLLTYALTVLTAAALLGGSAALYTQLGNPGAEDLPHAARLAASEAKFKSRPSQEAFLAKLPPRPQPKPDAQYKELIIRLREAVAANPEDLQGQKFLAQNEARLGNYPAAYKAQQKVLALKGDDATANDQIVLAQILLTEAQGYISPQAETAIRDALALDPEHPIARYFLGLLWLQNDRADRTLNLWSQLLSEGPDQAPWNVTIRNEISDIAWLAGVDYTPPPLAKTPGPTAEDVQNARSMSAEDRTAMIRSMVEQLNDRLATEGGTPEEWARLISALGVLSEKDRARAIWQEAQTRFAENPAALETVRAGARSAGVSE